MRQKLKPDGTEIVDLDRVMREPILVTGRKLLMDTFDNSNTADIMRRCLLNIYPLCHGDDTEKWLIQRVNSYSAVKNFEIATDLLRQLTLAKVDSERTDEQEEEFLGLTLEITLRIFIKRKQRNS